MHVLPARQHVFTQHQAAAKFDQLSIERDGGLVRHAFDRPVAGVGIDRRAGEHERVHLIGKARRDHRRYPAALTKSDEIHAAAEIVDRDDDLGEVVVDLQVLHVGGRRFPIGQGNMANSIGQQRLDQALAFMVVGDHGGMTGMRRIDERRDSARLSVVAQHHGPQIEPHLVRRRQDGSQLVMNFDLFVDEFEIFRVKLGTLLEHRRRHRHRPECRDAQQR